MYQMQSISVFLDKNCRFLEKDADVSRTLVCNLIYMFFGSSLRNV